jgi:cell division septum initiation protein DivIVA
VHGVPAKDLLEAIEKGQIPDALMSKLRLAIGDDGFEGSLDELRSGAMMRRPFTQNSQELAEQRRAFEADQSELVNYLSNWKQDPQQLLYGMRRLGMPIQEVAQMLLQEAMTADKLNEAVPGSGDEWIQAQVMKAEHADLLRQHQQAEAQRQQAIQAQKQEAISNNLRSIAVKEFELAGLDHKPTAWNLFREHCAAIYEETGKLSRADVRRAVVDTKGQIEDYIKKYNVQVERPTLGGPRLDGGAPRATNPSAPSRPGSRQLSSREFERQIRSGKV